MRPRILLTILLTALFVLLSGCGGVKNCPVCGTTTADGYANIVVIPVPEHNPNGEPGGPFNSFDISWLDPVHHLDYISDRLGLAVVVIDTNQNIAVNAIQGTNAITGAGDQQSPCATDPATGFDVIPPIVDVFGNFTRFGCRTDLTEIGGPSAPTFHLITGFGANHHFGGFPGAQCCASRSNGVNPMSGPDGLEVSADGNTLFVGNGSSSVVVFDLTTMNLGTNPPTNPTVLATIPTGVSADYDGSLGIAPCVSSWNGEAGSAADCGDDRADEMSYDNVHQVLAVINGDPGLPFITFIDMSHIVNKTGTLAQQHCLPIDATSAYGPYPVGFDPATYPLQGSGTGIPQPSPTLDPGVGGTSFNPPSCIIGQIYYDGAGGAASGGVGLDATVPVDNVGVTFPCPDPSNPHVFSGVSGSAAADGPLGLPGIGVTPSGASYTIPCHHGPLVDQTTGAFCSQTAPSGSCAGAIAPAGLGGMVWNSNTGHLLQTNGNSIGITNIGNVDEIDPRLTDTSCGGVSCGPVVVNSFVVPNCMPTGISQGPGNNFLVGCAGHDGQAFPPLEYVIDGTSGAILATINNVGGVDETWYNPGDNRYYLAARDMPTGPVMGVIDAKTNTWLENVTTGPNSHSIAVDPSTNHAFVPLQSGPACTTQSANGCVGVFAEQ
ncbi:MAG: YncE family protein [Candidatus Sulfotelmatobacter sp.]